MLYLKMRSAFDKKGEIFKRWSLFVIILLLRQWRSDFVFSRFLKVGSTTSRWIGGRTEFYCTRWWSASRRSMETMRTTYFIPSWMTHPTTHAGSPRRLLPCLVWYVHTNVRGILSGGCRIKMKQFNVYLADFDFALRY